MSGDAAPGAAEAGAWEATIRRVASSKTGVPAFTVVSFPELAAALNASTDHDLQQQIVYNARQASFDGETFEERREQRAKAIAACAWWWMADLQLAPEEYEALAAESLLLLPKKEVPPHRSRSARHAWARRQFLIAKRGGDAPRPFSQDVFSGKIAAGKNGEYQEALILLLRAMVSGSETVPAPSTQKRASPAPVASTPSGVAVTTGTMSAPEARERGRLTTPRRWWQFVLIGAGAILLVALVLVGIAMATRGEAPMTGPVPLPTEDEANRATEASWGPPRDTVSDLSRNSVVTLNSMIDSPYYGDERNFVRVSRADETAAEAVDEITLVIGESYTAYAYFNNDAADYDPSAVAEDARLRIQMPRTVYGSGAVHAFVSASNATPETVWDGATLLLPTADSTVALRYVPDSAFVQFNGHDNQINISLDDLASAEGAAIGCFNLDGLLPPAPQCGGLLRFQFKVDKPDFSVEAGVRVKGSDTSFGDVGSVSEGDVLEFRGHYLNTGTTVQNNIVVKSAPLPDGLRYVAGSARVSNSAFDFQYVLTAGDPTVDEGINLGNYAPGGDVYIKYDVIAQDVGSAGVRWIKLPHAVSFETQNGTKSAGLDLAIIRR